jgi:uncharacterized protein
MEGAMSFLILYLLSGLLAGFLAGLLGIGGGLVLVPLLAILFSAQGFSETVIMPLALGTSLATIIFTSVSSMAAHHAKCAVNWRAVRGMAPGTLLGALFSTAMAAHVPSAWLQLVFAIYAGLAATQLLYDFKPVPSRQLPGFAGLTAAGGVVGGVSGLAGVGGAVTSIPFLLWCNVPARTAIGTAAAIGLPVSLSGTVGYVAGGWTMASVPPASLGFVYLPALAAIVIATMLSAPLGARASHSLPVQALKKMLAAVLYLVTLRMVLSWA